MDIENKSQEPEINLAIFYITNNGFGLAKRLKGLYPDAILKKFNSEAIPKLWNENKRLIFIMATGIVVRTIAPLIRDKKTDPAIIVLDDKGKFAISLLSGHLGGANEIAKEIADFLGAEAIITTASDTNNFAAIDLWAKENNLVIDNWKILPHLSTKLINNGVLKVYIDLEQKQEIKLPKEFLRVNEPTFADILITNRQLKSKIPNPKSQLYLRPKNLVIGIGCNSGTSAEEIEDAVKTVLNENNLSFLSIYSLATIDIKLKEKGLLKFAEKYGFEITAFTADELNTVEGVKKSEAVFSSTGANAVSCPAALLASGASELLVPKQKIGNVTIAVAKVKELESLRIKKSNKTLKLYNSTTSKLYIIGTGPGSIEHITPYAQDAIRKSDVIVGYSTYLDLIKGMIKDKEIISTGMTQEIDRCKKAIEMAINGKTVSVISGGDPGIYAMAGLVFEILREQQQLLSNLPVHVEVIPGISALNAAASRLGAPLMHDFACISLSDRLTPWNLIEKRLEAASMADFVIVLYNPKSRERTEHIIKAQEIVLKYRVPETPVGIVKCAMRENERIIITNLRSLLNYDIDMQTTIIIGNSHTFTWNNLMITPRGYVKSYLKSRI